MLAGDGSRPVSNLCLCGRASVLCNPCKWVFPVMVVRGLLRACMLIGMRYNLWTCHPATSAELSASVSD